MKQFLTIISIFVFTGFNLSAQNIFQLTFKKVEGKPNAVKIVMKPNTNRTGQISSMQFSVSIPWPQTTVPVPVLTSLIEGVTYVLANDVSTIQSADGQQFRTWTYLGVGGASTATVNYLSGVEYDVAELVLGSPDNVLVTARLSAYPDGGTDGQSYFYMALNGTQVVNTPAQFYGAGAVNGAFETGYSFVPLADFSLPVNFLSFYALKNGDDAKLSWNVSNDEKNDYFEIQRSLDGRNFQSIQRINAASNGRTDNSYEAADLSLSKLGTREVFYQISQFDKDGMSTKSPVRKLSIDGLGKSVTAFPNPARTTTKLLVDAPEAGKGVISMYDNLGRQVQTMNAQFFKGTNQFDLNVMGLSSGDYNIQVRGAGLNETIKIAKIN